MAIKQSFLIPLLTILSCSYTLGIQSATIAPSLHRIGAEVENLNSSPTDSYALSLYKEGQFKAARSIWQQLYQQAQDQGDIQKQIVYLNHLAIANYELGEWSTAKEQITQAFTLAPPDHPLLAQLHNTQASLSLMEGQPQQALEQWQLAEQFYEILGDTQGTMGTKLNQAQSLQAMGFYRQSQQLLEQVYTDISPDLDPLLRIKALESLGSTFQITGNLIRGGELLQAAIAIADQENQPEIKSSILFNLGNNYRAQEKLEEAFDYYGQAAQLTQNQLLRLEAQVNQLAILKDQENWEEVKALNLIIQPQFREVNLNPSRRGVSAQINLVQSLIEVNDQDRTLGYERLELAQLLSQVITNTRNLGDAKLESYGLGTLGHLYEQNQQWEEAKKTTMAALTLAEAMKAKDISYQWQWQLGRIHQAQGNLDEAISAFTIAVNTLQILRTDLVAINSDVRFSFKEKVEPVYRGLVSLLLTPPNGVNYQKNNGLKTTDTQDKTPIPQSNLIKAREIIESLRIAELDNFFKEACITVNSEQIEQIDPLATVIYPILLEDKLAVIASNNEQELSYHAVDVPQAEQEDVFRQLRQTFNPAFSSRQRLKLSTQVYDWLIRPIEDDLTSSQTKTLIFVLDGPLRNLPMAALYDGKQYLIEKYQIALTSGLQLIPTDNIDKQSLGAIAAGVSQSRQGFSALPGVEFELDQINSQLSSRNLLNQEFTKERLAQQIQLSSSPIVHLATHGQFSSDPDQTFIITWDGQVNVKEFEQLLKYRNEGKLNPIELLVLSACQTALGDDRAALGLAGMALKSGARSTIATLWSVKDESTALLMSQFYTTLSKGNEKDPVSKAEALRQAQIDLLKSEKFNHPFYWAPFTLVGNWL